MKKKSIITMMLALPTLAGLAQTKTATVTGYSPTLKDGTLVIAGTGTIGTVVDTVQAGHFAFTLPVEEFTEGSLSLMGDGCPNFNLTLFLRPSVTVKVTGKDCLYPLWKVESPLPEQQTQNCLTDHCRDVIAELLQMDLDNKPWPEREPVEMKYMKQRMDILPSLPVDAATIRALWGISMTAKNTKDFPYMEQLKKLEKAVAASAPKGFEEQLAEIHNFVYPPRVLQIGEEAVDAELIDMQGQKHHLSEVLGQQGKYVLLDFWGIGCGPCMMSEPEMRVFYERIKNKMEIVAINQNKLSEWQKHEFSQRIVGKNWNNATKDVSSRYCDIGAIPYYILISPEKRILWKGMGYSPGLFLGLADVVNGFDIKQDNSANFNLSIRKVEANANGTTVSFRYYSHKDYWFRIVKESYLEANGKKYKLTAANGITLDENNYTTVKATDSTEDFLSKLSYIDFTLTFEPFDIIPATFDFKEGDGQGAFVIRNITCHL
jgi:thiol-disulfide isomerase/thioredoxin